MASKLETAPLSNYCLRITKGINIYGGALDDAMREANSKVVKAVIQ